MTNRVCCVAMVALVLASGALAQDEDLPLRNWGAPPYWTPTVVAKESGPEGEIQASAQGMIANAQALPSSPLPFVAITPCRIVDTRVAVADGFHEPNFADNETRVYDFPTSPDCAGLPATAGAWSLNVQFRPISQPSFITLFPDNITMPTVATLTASPAAWVQNAAVVPGGFASAVAVYCQYAGRVVIDVNGYYEPQSVVNTLNAMTGDLTLTAGSNVTITPSANTLTIAATGGPGGTLPAGTAGQTLYNNGSAWTASSALTNNGTNVAISGSVDVAGVLSLGPSSGTSGQIDIGGFAFAHQYGSDNAFLGTFAGNFTMTGNANTGLGWAALSSDTSGHDNTATGFYSLINTSTGAFNTGDGSQTLYLNSTGTMNSAFGVGSLYANISGNYNTGVGVNAGNRSDTIVGYDNVSAAVFQPSESGSWNTFIGEGTGATAQVDNCTAVGVDAYCTTSNQVRLGNRFVGSIGGEVGWSALSDLRAKTDIHDISLGLDFVLALRPVEYRLRSGNGKTDMGFVAQDIEALLGDGYNVLDIGGDPERTLSLRHTDLIAPLVKAVQEQETQILKQQGLIQARDEKIEALGHVLDALQAKVADLQRKVQNLVVSKDATKAAATLGD
jgi:hypothetical protein